MPSSSRLDDLNTPYTDDFERATLAAAAERTALAQTARPAFSAHPDPAPSSSFGMADVHGRTDDDTLQREFARSVHFPVGGGSFSEQVSILPSPFLG
jgi:hypothetical protein